MVYSVIIILFYIGISIATQPLGQKAKNQIFNLGIMFTVNITLFTIIPVLEVIFKLIIQLS